MQGPGPGLESGCIQSVFTEHLLSTGPWGYPTEQVTWDPCPRKEPCQQLAGPHPEVMAVRGKWAGSGGPFGGDGIQAEPQGTGVNRGGGEVCEAHC